MIALYATHRKTGVVVGVGLFATVQRAQSYAKRHAKGPYEAFGVRSGIRTRSGLANSARTAYRYMVTEGVE